MEDRARRHLLYWGAAIFAFLVFNRKTGNGTLQKDTQGGGYSQMAMAIANAEGWNASELQRSRHNPGNIRDFSLPGWPIKQFATDDDGWAALESLVAKIKVGVPPYPEGASIAEVARIYTGEAQYMNWSNNVAAYLGVSSNIPFSEVA